MLKFRRPLPPVYPEFIEAKEFTLKHTEVAKKEENLGVAINKENQFVTWRHPGGKLRRYGAEKLTDAELLAVLIGAGTRGLSANEIANEILKRYQSFRGLANQPFEELSKIKGLKDVKVTRIAAAMEIARRIVKQSK